MKPRETHADEADRHELRAVARYRFALNRRDFLERVGAGVVVLVAARGTQVWAELPDGRQQIDDTVSAWLHIAEDGAVTVFTGKVEVGQDIRTSLTQAVAEELHVDPAAIRLVMGDTDLVPFDAGTFGSRSTPQMGSQLRRAAARARTLLLQRAASQWNVDVARLSLSGGRVQERAANRSVGIGQITRGEKLVHTMSGDVATKPAGQWTVAGRSLPKVNGRDIVTGRHRYPADQTLPDMLVGKVLRAPANGAKLLRVDDAAARALPGVTVVVDGEFAGVAARDEATAARALALLRAEWQQTTQPSQRELFQHLKRTARPPAPDAALESALAGAKHRHDAAYQTQYIAHVPLEPRAAAATWENGRLTVWTGTQRPFGVRGELARAFSIGEDRVRVIVPDTGSGYGGKHTGECAIEAARLARAAGRPVKLVWTREEEFAWAYFRPAALIEIRSGVHADGSLAAWDFIDYNAGAAGLRSPYEVGARREQSLPSETPLRQGSYRALAATANTFARESHMDELAARLQQDPLAFRLRNLRDPRLRPVLEAAAARFGWSSWQATPGRGIGIACGSEKGGYSASCAEVAVDAARGRITVLRIVQAFECGAIVNPDGLQNQVEGAVVMGLGGALWEAIEFENGRILNPRLSQYRVPRFSDLPPIDIVLLDRKDLPSAGAGETPIITLAPALAGALFRATGKRVRALPLAPALPT